MSKCEKILVINPGSTSTKIAMYDGETSLWQDNIEHRPEDLAKYPAIFDQVGMRREQVIESVNAHGDKLTELAAVVSRGGPIAPLHSGAYEVNEDMLYTIQYHPQDQHAALTGAVIAYGIAGEIGKKAYIYDAVTVDEMLPLVKVTGLPEMERRGQGHNLNMRAAALKLCQDEGMDYYASTIIVAHLGGGITVSLHENGRIADIISDDEGPFSPERAGGLPGFQIIDTCYGGVSKKDFEKRIKRSGGLMAYFGTTDVRKVRELIDAGDEKAKLVYEAMAMNVAKNISKLAPVVSGHVDRIVLTGGIAYSKEFTDLIAGRVSFIAPVTVIPGENEMEALAKGCLRVLSGQETARIYRDAQRPAT